MVKNNVPKECIPFAIIATDHGDVAFTDVMQEVEGYKNFPVAVKKDIITTSDDPMGYIYVPADMPFVHVQMTSAQSKAGGAIDVHDLKKAFDSLSSKKYTSCECGGVLSRDDDITFCTECRVIHDGIIPG